MGEDTVQNIGKDDFLDPEDSKIHVRGIRSGHGRVSVKGPLGRRRASRGSPLQSEAVCDASGRLGWRVQIPNGRPLATPAVVDGRVFLGGGFGSYEFYSFDAKTGELLWQLRTKDDGPTAATVAGDHVVFNTESCTVFVVRAEDGQVVWEKWLGDPLMAQTAVFDGAVFAAYPSRGGLHHLAAFDLHTGKQRWRTQIEADVISAPIVAEGSVYAATLDGTMYRLDIETGEPSWSIDQKATSAPWILNGKLYMSLREDLNERGERFAAEGYDSVTVESGVRRRARSSSRRKADYLRYMAEKHRRHAEDDAKVGFATPPSSAKLGLAAAHLGVGHVASVWAYQGSRPEVFADGIFCVLDDIAQRLEVDTKNPVWRVKVEVEGRDDGLGLRMLSPPAVSGNRLYFTSSLGDVFVLDRCTGEELWSLNVNSPVLSQPAVAEGQVFVGTRDGTLYAFENDDTDATGWTMWGGGPGHNGPSV